MRGKVASEKTLLIGTGITPAYAGKSLCLLRQKDDVWDHPRLCGEKMLWGRWNLYILGSPPPMRGKASGTFKSPFSSGITPAYAGKRRCGRRNGLCVQDHPRLCGEKKDRPPFSGCRLGSPPPMRGKGITSLPSTTSTRITPAYAGKRIVLHRSPCRS